MRQLAPMGLPDRVVIDKAEQSGGLESLRILKFTGFWKPIKILRSIPQNSFKQEPLFY